MKVKVVIAKDTSLIQQIFENTYEKYIAFDWRKLSQINALRRLKGVCFHSHLSNVCSIISY